MLNQTQKAGILCEILGLIHPGFAVFQRSRKSNVVVRVENHPTSVLEVVYAISLNGFTIASRKSLL